MEDEPLLDALRRGEDYAAAFLVSRYGESLTGFARAIAPDLGDADRERIIELGIERAARRIDQYDANRASIRGWLKMYVRFAALDWRSSHARLVTHDPELDRPDLPPATPDERRREGQLQAIVRGALDQLSPSDRYILESRDILGVSVAEVAEELGIGLDACRQRHHRARLRLRAAIEANPDLTTLIPGVAK